MRNKVLIVDDVEINRILLEEILSEDYDVIMAENGRQAFELLEKWKDETAVVLLDLIMPEMDGFTLLEELTHKEWAKHIAIMIISGDNTAETEERCFELGVTDFIHRPFDNYLVKKRVKNVVSLYQYQEGLEKTVEKQTEKLHRQNLQLQEQAEQLRLSKMNVIDILGTVVEYRNLESGEHIKRVKEYTRILSTQLMNRFPEYGLTQENIDVIVSASALHDVGKIAVPDSILLKPGKLTSEEFEIMKTHTTKGCEIINNIKNVWDKEYEEVAYEICRYHHERYNGKGYPDGLIGDEIPISAQIVSIADVYDALVSERVYKKAIDKEKAYQMITGGECGEFSPKLLECFACVKEEFENLQM